MAGSAPQGITETPEALAAGLAAMRYLADDGLATAIFLAILFLRPSSLFGQPAVSRA